MTRAVVAKWRLTTKAPLLTDIPLTTAPLVVTHSLGFVPNGILAASLSADARVWFTAYTKTTVTVTASAACTARLVVWLLCLLRLS